MLSPYRFDGERRATVEMPPDLGGHTAEVLQSVLGCSESDISALAGKGAFGPVAS
jgi:crotonobetainyl-CoA:carnitine CoA-transferase CaiB-like acyl-CoA transferase